jgi:D-serine deaminase-like pyridoxal phosphate-dependent protein
MGDEHGAVIHPATPQGRDVEDMDADPALPWPADAPHEGDLVWLQPGHCDPTINLYDALWAVHGDGRMERWDISARRVTPATADRRSRSRKLARWRTTDTNPS